MSHRDDEDVSAEVSAEDFHPQFDANGHVAEESVYAWLDGAFDDDDSERVRTHVAGCSECSSAVTEARGFIAGASRIVGALDAVPRNVVPRDVVPPDVVARDVAALDMVMRKLHPPMVVASRSRARDVQRDVSEADDMPHVAAPDELQLAANIAAAPFAGGAQDFVADGSAPIDFASYAPAPIAMPAPMREPKRPWYMRSSLRAAAALLLVIGGATYVVRSSGSGSTNVATSAALPAVPGDRSSASDEAHSLSAPMPAATSAVASTQMKSSDSTNLAPSVAARDATSEAGALPRAAKPLAAIPKVSTRQPEMSSADAPRQVASRNEVAPKLMASAPPPAAPSARTSVADSGMIVSSTAVAPEKKVASSGGGEIMARARVAPSAPVVASPPAQSFVPSNVAGATSLSSAGTGSARMRIANPAADARAIRCFIVSADVPISPSLPLGQINRVSVSGDTATYAISGWPSSGQTTLAKLLLTPSANEPLTLHAERGADLLDVKFGAIDGRQWAAIVAEQRGGVSRTATVTLLSDTSAARCAGK